MVTTALSSLIFLVGVVLFLFGPLPETKNNTAAADALDAGAALAIVPPDAAPPERPLVAPKGMAVVPAGEDHPAFFIAIEPVRYGEFSEMFPSKKKRTKNKKKNLAALTKVSFADALSYARTYSGRLATPSEWASALATKSLSLDSLEWEWLDDGTEGTQAPRAVGAPSGEVASRRPREYNDVGFRLVTDP